MAEMSPWLAEQVEAARADRALALEAVGITGETTDEGGRDPINAAVDATIDTWMAKGAKSCPHLASRAPASLPFPDGGGRPVHGDGRRLPTVPWRDGVSRDGAQAGASPVVAVHCAYSLPSASSQYVCVCSEPSSPNL
jgi:hypothetical protein